MHYLWITEFYSYTVVILYIVVFTQVDRMYKLQGGPIKKKPLLTYY